ncbi:vWA domain-containing protein [Mariniluteicoccus flavus]
MSGLDEVLLTFAARLREAGVAVSPDRAATMVRAVALVDLLDRCAVAAATRATCCASPADVTIHDAVFAAYFGRRSGTVEPVPTEVEVVHDDPGTGQGPAEPGAPREVANAAEALRNRPLVGLADAERDEARRLLAALRLKRPRRRTRRRGRGGHRLDARATTRTLLRHGGEPVGLRRRRPGGRPRRVVVLVDVSGSMKPWADAYLRFAHALHRAHGAEVFTLATRLTRVTGALARPSVDAAIAEASRAMPDWTGGTRLADGLRALADDWGRRGPLRGAVVVVVSDGLERGEPAALAEAVARVRRLAHRIVWIHPRAGAEGWRPATRGLAAALPFVDALVAGDSVAALEDAGRVIARSRREDGPRGTVEREWAHA